MDSWIFCGVIAVFFAAASEEDGNISFFLVFLHRENLCQKTTTTIEDWEVEFCVCLQFCGSEANGSLKSY